MEKLDIPPEEVELLVKEIAGLLGESARAPVKQIRKIIQYCGTDFTREVYKATVEVEEQGGMMLPNKSRRRTIGGVFFYLAREKISDDRRQIIFPPFTHFKKPNQTIPVGIPLFTWNERISLIESLQTDQGEIKSMKITLSGRPGRIEKRPEVVVTTMSYIASVPNLPRGIPTPPVTPTLYTVYIASKQWERIESAMADPADNMLIDGICAFDPETNSMAVFATTVRSELLDAKSKEAVTAKPPKQAAPKAAKSDKADGSAKGASPSQPQEQGKAAKKSRIANIQPEPVSSVAVSLNPNLPPDVARKLTDLYASASLFRQKVVNLQAKPPGQQFGLEMTQKLLKNVEDEIAALEKKHNS